MYRLRMVADPDECQAVWNRVIPQESISDLWEMRECFHRHFQHPPCFLVAEDSRGICGFLPLSWIEESDCYGYFPGETWAGKTWLEQNRIVARNEDVLRAMLEYCPGRFHLRYLNPLDCLRPEQHTVDEIGYLFLPPKYGYDIENYFLEFSNKSRKRVRKELAAVESLGVRYRYDDFSDFDAMVRLSLGRFGERSYFHDPRFLEGFRSLRDFLHERGWLRVTTVLIGDEPAAVDLGCARHGACTLLAGGASGDYPGVAKLINLHHMRRACEERMRQADFLCGDFSWKTLFHLTPRPLYLISNVAAEAYHSDALEPRSAACAV